MHETCSHKMVNIIKMYTGQHFRSVIEIFKPSTPNPNPPALSRQQPQHGKNNLQLCSPDMILSTVLRKREQSGLDFKGLRCSRPSDSASIQGVSPSTAEVQDCHLEGEELSQVVS